ncbi:MAG TPA: serine/threonine-protein kinase, partial [Myxococcota bacterium]|nr:serine/threonine-protein kinase [Myxococcota bacterium]
LHPHLAGDPVARERLRREVVAAHRIPGGGCLKIFDFIEEEEDVFLVEERAERDLAQQLPLPLEEGLAVGAAVARTLQRAHGAGVLHRDLKPSNLLLLAGESPLAERVRLADFGLARLEDRAGGTATAALAGSVGYTAPEVYDGILDDPRSDQYALAACIHELLTGQLPWGTELSAEILRKQLSEEAKPSAELPPAVQATLGRALSRSPDGRFATLDLFAAALEAALRGESPAPVETGPLCPHCGARRVRGLGVCPGCGRRTAIIPRGKGAYQARVYAPPLRIQFDRNNNFDTLTFTEKQTIVTTTTEATGAPLRSSVEVDTALRRPIIIAADGLDRSGADAMVGRLREKGLSAEVFGPDAPGRFWREWFVKLFPAFPAVGLAPVGFAFLEAMERGDPAMVGLLVPVGAIVFASAMLRWAIRPRPLLAEGPGGTVASAEGVSFGKELEDGLASIHSASVRGLLGEVFRAAAGLQEALSTAPENARQEGRAAAKEACEAALSLAKRLEWVEEAQPTRRGSRREANIGEEAQREEAEVRIRSALLSLAADLRKATTGLAAQPEAMLEAREAVDRLHTVITALGAAPAPADAAHKARVAAQRQRQ